MLSAASRLIAASSWDGPLAKLRREAAALSLFAEAFASIEDLRLRERWKAEGKSAANSPLYNRHLLGDNHLSPLGCALWGRLMAERLGPILVRYDVLPTSLRPVADAKPSS